MASKPRAGASRSGIDNRLNFRDLEGEAALAAAVDYVANMDAKAREARFAEIMRELSRIDASHPPTLYRLELAKALAIAAPGLRLTLIGVGAGGLASAWLNPRPLSVTVMLLSA